LKINTKFLADLFRGEACCKVLVFCMLNTLKYDKFSAILQTKVPSIADYVQ